MIIDGIGYAGGQQQQVYANKTHVYSQKRTSAARYYRYCDKYQFQIWYCEGKHRRIDSIEHILLSFLKKSAMLQEAIEMIKRFTVLLLQYLPVLQQSALFRNVLVASALASPNRLMRLCPMELGVFRIMLVFSSSSRA